MSVMPTLTGASRNARTQGDHTHAPVGLATDSDMIAVRALVLVTNSLILYMHGCIFFSI